MLYFVFCILYFLICYFKFFCVVRSGGSWPAFSLPHISHCPVATTRLHVSTLLLCEVFCIFCFWYFVFFRFLVFCIFCFLYFVFFVFCILCFVYAAFGRLTLQAKCMWGLNKVLAGASRLKCFWGPSAFCIQAEMLCLSWMNSTDAWTYAHCTEVSNGPLDVLII